MTVPVLGGQSADHTRPIMLCSSKSWSNARPSCETGIRRARRRNEPMEIRAILPPRGRDYRLDLLRGFANWAIYLDHIPDNAVNWITQKNFGFSDAADLFVFISGYTVRSFMRGSCW